MTDFNLAGYGETTNELIMLIQEIETIMTAKPLDIITDGALTINLDNYLFKHGIDPAQVGMIVKHMLLSGVTNTLNFSVDIAVAFLSTQKQNDLLLVQIFITGQNIQQTMVEYAVTKQLQAIKINS
jgi:hypothetical protein